MASTHSVWRCNRCTLHNPASRHTCSACGFIRPSAQKSMFGAVFGTLVQGSALLAGAVGAAASIFLTTGLRRKGAPLGFLIGGLGAAVGFEVMRLTVLNRQRRLRARQRTQQIRYHDVATETVDPTVIRELLSLVHDGQNGQNRQQRIAMIQLLLSIHRQQEEDERTGALQRAFEGVQGPRGAPSRRVPRAEGGLSLPLALANLYAESLEYDELLELFGEGHQPSPGVDPTVLRQLPTHTLTSKECALGVGAKAAQHCPICLELFQEGEIIKHLPCCNYAFHGECVDAWLVRSAGCPLCRTQLQVTEGAIEAA